MSYLFDTDIVSIILRGREPRVLGRVTRLVSDAANLSIISVYELYFGAAVAAQADRLRQKLRKGLSGFTILQFDQSDALHAADIRAALRQVGTPIGPYDTLIAGQARARGLTLVSRNLKEFGRVPGLLLQDWR